MQKFFRPRPKHTPGRGRQPARWTIWEVLLLGLSVLLIIFPLYAETYRWINPLSAPAQEIDPAPSSEPAPDVPVEPPTSDVPVEPPTSDVPVEPPTSDVPVEPPTSDVPVATEVPVVEASPAPAPAPENTPELGVDPTELPAEPRRPATFTPEPSPDGTVVAPTSTTDPVEPTSTTDPVEPTSTTDPVEPTSTTDPVEPTSTTDPVEPTSTTDPVEPTSTSDVETPVPTNTFVPTRTSIPSSPITLFKQASDDAVNPGQQFSYFVSIFTTSTSDVQVSLSDVIDSRLQVLSAGSGCSAGQTVTCALTVRDGSPASVTIQVQVQPNTQPGTITNQASASGGGSSTVSDVVAVTVLDAPPVPTVTSGTSISPTSVPTNTSVPNVPTNTSVPNVPTNTPVPNAPTNTPSNGGGDDNDNDDDDDDDDDNRSGDSSSSDATPIVPPAPPESDSGPLPPPPTPTPLGPASGVPGVPAPPPVPVQPPVAPPVQQPAAPPVQQPAAPPQQQQPPLVQPQAPVATQVPVEGGEQATVAPEEANTPQPAPTSTGVFFRMASDWGSTFAGNEVQYTIVLWNTRAPSDDGANDLTDIVISSNLPSNVEVLGSQADRGNDPTVNGNSMQYVLDRLQPGEAIEITIAAKIKSLVDAGTLIVAQAQLQYAGVLQSLYSNIVTVLVVEEVSQVSSPTVSPTRGVSGSPRAVGTATAVVTGTVAAYPPPSSVATLTKVATSIPTKVATSIPTVVDPTEVPLIDKTVTPTVAAAVGQAQTEAPLPATSAGVPMLGFVILGLTLFIRQVRLHRERERI